MSSDWPILKNVALQVAEGMLHGRNLSRNGCYTWFFLATCNATFVALQVARKIASCNMAFKEARKGF